MTARAATIEIEDDILLAAGRIGDTSGTKVYVVGGYVRDRLLGRPGTDLDILVIGDGIAFASAVSRALGSGRIVTYEKFGTAMIPLGDRKVEFVTAREERYEPSSRKPTVKQASLESDLSRRDFTINAIAVSLNGEQRGTMVDPFDGKSDLSKRIIRTPLAPDRTFDDDPLRMLRAIRFASQLGFGIEAGTLDGIRKMRDRTPIVSQERITEEFLKILGSPRPSTGLKLLQDTGLASHVFPELVDMVGVEQRKEYHHKDVFLHTLRVVDNIAEAGADLWLRFTALVHDIAKPRTKAFKEGIGWTFHGHEELGARMMKSVFRRMRLPMERLPYVEKLVRLHLRPMVLVSEEVTDSAVRRLLFESGELIDDLMMLCRADITSQNPARVARYMRNYDIVMAKMREVEEKDRLRNWQPPVRGDEIMAVCGLEPGRTVGILKKRIEEAILDGEIPNEHAAALAYLLSIKDQVLQENP